MTTFHGPPLEADTDAEPLTIGGFLAETVARHGMREAVVSYNPNGRLSWTYGGLLGAAHAIGRSLIACGVEPGDRVALLMGNRPAWVASAFGVALAGGVLVPVNTYLERKELAYVLTHSDATTLLMQTELAGHDYLQTIGALIEADELPVLRTAACIGIDHARASIDPWDRFAERGNETSTDKLASRAARIDPGDDAMIIYTSGTTAAPKGVVHSHVAPVLQSKRFVRHLVIDETARSWCAFPLFWTAGFAMFLGATLAAGGCVVLQERFEPGEALELISKERVTIPHAWPHQIAELESHPDWRGADLSSLRQVEPFSPFHRHPSATGVLKDWSPRAAFGLTETFTIITSTPADAPAEVRDRATGAILPGNAIRILDPETGESQPAGADGEIACTGATMMKGYLKVPNDETFDADGFFRTGDAGRVDQDGFLHWTGRTSDMIKTGGANVSPVEIELELLHHPGLRAAGAVGVPHETLGQIVVVVAVVQDGSTVTEDDVRRFLSGRIASYKIPRRVVFVREEDLSLTGNQKIRPEELRSLAAARLSSTPE